ncbi:MAG: DUF2628 domain-containing protein [Alphaproteobacteria bacterium]|nr:DUF2628 domain-containing protein [Alphaproteobacteria bacterium]
MKIETTNNNSVNDYYIEAFRKLENGKKHSWNWAAAIFGTTWLIYRKMYLYAFLFLLLDVFAVFIVYSATSEKIGSDYFVDRSTFEAIYVWGIGAISFLFFGYYGNRLYYKAVKKKISKGYHLLNRYHSYSISIIAMTIIVSICFEALNSETPDKIPGINVLLENVGPNLFWFFAIGCYALADWIARTYYIKKHGENQNFDVSEENIHRYLKYSNRNHLPGQILSAFCFAVCLITCQHQIDEHNKGRGVSTVDKSVLVPADKRTIPIKK